MSSVSPKLFKGGPALAFLPSRAKPAIKKDRNRQPDHHRSTLSVHFADMSGRELYTIGRHGSVGALLARTNSDGEGSVSSLSDSDLGSLDGARGPPDYPGFSPNSSSSSQLSGHGVDVDGEEEGEENEENKYLKQMDLLGVALENTFKEVESIDTYVQKLREDFDHEMMNEHTFITHICTARMARAACCKRQLSVWQHLQHELIDYCCHFHHIHDHDDLSNHSDDLNRNHNGHDSSHQEPEIEAVIGSLNRMPTFDVVKKRLEPDGDSKSFVSHWILHGEDALGHQHFSEANNNVNDTDSDSFH